MARARSGASATPPPAEVYTGFALSVLGAIATVAGTIERFGLKGACLWGALVLLTATLIVGSRHWHFRLPWNLGQRFAAYFPSSSPTRWFIAATIAFLALALGLHVFDIGKAYFWRVDFTLDHTKLPIDRTAFGLSEFLPTLSEDLGTQQARERAALLPWLRWIAQGANQPENREPPPGSDKDESLTPQQYSLVYLASTPFGSRYKDLHLTLSFVEAVSIDDASAFLVSGFDEPPWWKGTWRQMFVYNQTSKKALGILATNPNPGERLVVFVRITPEEGDDFPAVDQLVPFHAFEVHR